MTQLKLNRHLKIVALTLLTFAIASTAVAVDGWELIKSNDFVAAKRTFENQLEQNKKHVESLIGLIFLAEVAEDDDSYEKYIDDLIEANWDEHHYLLFNHLLDKAPPEVLRQNLSYRAKAKATFGLADSLFYNRQKKHANKVLRSFVGDYNWSIIGPFKNTAGSGHIIPHTIEKEPFNTEKAYLNHRKHPLKWLTRKLRNPNGMVQFSNYLPNSQSGVYYANTFLNVPTTQTLQFRIVRTTPMKIWLDDALIFDNEHNISSIWDAEIVELNLAAGQHRLLVKCSDLPLDRTRGNLSLNYYENNSRHTRKKTSKYYKNNHRRSSNAQFTIRITNTIGQHIQNITSDFTGTYTPHTYETKFFEKQVIQHFKQIVEKTPNVWANYYLLCKAYLKFDGYSESGEQHFLQIYQQHQEAVYFKFLMAKFYAANGKGERAEKLITGLDEQKIPIFKIVFKEFQKLDEEEDEKEYVAMLDKLQKISPTNWDIIRGYIQYYGKKGMLEEKRNFIKKFVAKYPKYEEQLEPYLKDESYKPSSYKPTTDKEREKAAKKALKKLKSTYAASYYQTVIRYYKNQEKEKINKVIKYYDLMIEMEPYKMNLREEKAEYLFEKERYDDALAVLHEVTKITPYDSDIYETIGDIYHEKKDKQKALKYYKLFKQFNTGSSWYSRGVDEKIEKIEEKEQFNKLFDTPTFETALEDEAWKTYYKDEESVILLYTIEGELSEDNTLELDQKVLIKVQSEAGVKYWTEADFGMFGRLNYVRVIKPDGKELTPERSGSYVVFKNLEAGDLIQLEGSYNMNMSYELDNELFFIVPLAYEAAIYRTKVELMIPKDKYLQFRCNRLACDYQKRTTKGRDILTWESYHTPKMEREEAVLDELDTYAWLMMSSLKDWSRVVEWYTNKTYRRLEANYEVKQVVDTLIKADMTEQEKVICLYNFITKAINYSFVPFLQSNFTPKVPGATCSAGIGDCKDVASLMIAMLREINIEAYYVLVKTRNFTDLEPTPSILFDHVIVGYVLDGKMQYLDLTTDFYPYYVIHEGDSDAWGLVIREGSNQIFRLPNDHLNPTKSQLDVVIDATFHLDRAADLTVSTKAKGVVGGYLKEKLHLLSDEERRKFISKYFGQSVFESLTIKDYHFNDLKAITAPLTADFKFKADKFLDKISRFYVFEIPFMKAASRKSELLPEQRYNNLDLHQIMDIYPNVQVVNITMPVGFRLSEVPSSVTMSNPFFDYEVTYKATPQGMRVYRKVNFKKRLVKKEDYQTFKALYLQMVEADNLKLAMER